MDCQQSLFVWKQISYPFSGASATRSAASAGLAMGSSAAATQTWTAFRTRSYAALSASAERWGRCGGRGLVEGGRAYWPRP